VEEGNLLTKLIIIKLVVLLKVRGIVVPVPVCCVVQECRTRGVKISHVANICILYRHPAAAALSLGYLPVLVEQTIGFDPEIVCILWNREIRLPLLCIEAILTGSSFFFNCRERQLGLSYSK
jgi:hypothetical protein